MKRALFFTLAIVMTLVAACQPSENQNQNKNATANTNGTTTSNKNQTLSPPLITCSRMEQIWVHDSKTTPGGYDIDDPGSATLSIALKQTINWCVVYDGVDQSNRPDEIEINGFATTVGPLYRNPLDDSTSDDDYHIPASQFNDNCVVVCHAPKPDVVLGNYKYVIKAWTAGVVKGQLDPRVIISS
jgi:hypothetical protein